MLASGCYFSPAPLPADPSPERPNLDLNGAVPPPFAVLNVRGTESVNFTVPFTSVDADSGIRWFLWSNWNMASEDNRPIQDLQKKGSLTARPPDANLGLGGAGAVERSITFVWTPNGAVLPGCNQLTLIVTHADNVNTDTDLPFDLSLAAMATYWVNVNAPLDQSQTLTNCPSLLVGP